MQEATPTAPRRPNPALPAQQILLDEAAKSSRFPLFEFRNRELLADFAEVMNIRTSLVEDILTGIHFTSLRENPAALLDQLIELVEARACLDGGQDRDEPQVALLADMSERSVRNALSLEGPAGLRSKRADARDARSGP